MIIWSVQGVVLGQIFGYEVEGIYKNQEEINQREVKQYLSEVRPGDLKLKDQNGDKRIDQYDQVAMDVTLPVRRFIMVSI